MTRITNRMETIFAHAVALEQNGRLRNTVHCIDEYVFVVNSDQTVLLQFPLNKSEGSFEEPVSFRANDYDSRDLRIDNGKVQFVQEAEGMVRVKSCAVPDITPEDVQNQFDVIPSLGKEQPYLTIRKGILSLIDESLSHVEILVEDGDFLLRQRNIYSGGIIEIKKAKQKGLMALHEFQAPDEMEPIGIRTNDLIALLTFHDYVRIKFGEAGCGYSEVYSDDATMLFRGYLSHCVYDELGNISYFNQGDTNGRQIKKSGRGKQRSDSESESKPSKIKKPIARKTGRRRRQG